MAKPNRCSGFSLIEVLVTFIVLVLGLLALLRVHYGALSVSAEAKARTEALHFAQKKMESSRNIRGYIDYGAINSTTDSYINTEVYDRDLVVTTVTGPIVYRELELNTEWTNSRNNPIDVTLRSYIHRESPVKSGVIIKELNEASYTDTCACTNAGGVISHDGSDPANCSNQCCKLNAGTNPPANFTAYCFAN